MANQSPKNELLTHLGRECLESEQNVWDVFDCYNAKMSNKGVVSDRDGLA